MAELEALCFIPDKAPSGSDLKQAGWRKDLPVNKTIKLGRWPKEADWCVEEDRSISRFNANIVWNGTSLAVSQPTDREVSPIFYHNKHTPTFALNPGESFVIGTTKFTLHSGAGTLSPEQMKRTGNIGTNDVDRPARAESVEDRANLTLKNAPIDHAAAVVRALERLPSVLRLGGEDPDQQLRQLVDILLRAVPSADAAAIVQLSPDATKDNPRVSTLCHIMRRSSAADSFTPSRSMTFKAIRDRRSVLRVWTEKEEQTLRAGELPGVPWAICTPLRDGSGCGLYVDGGLNREPSIINGIVTDPELTGYQKVVELLASIVESARSVYIQQRRNATFIQFIPKVLRDFVDHEELEKRLKPRTANVTVLFCDLRGSCKIAADGSSQLTTTWEKVAEALDDIANTVSLNDGVVAGFQGDAVMAFWGWPHDQPDQIERAVRTALRIRERFDADGWWDDLMCGLGIAHGAAIVGKLGAHDLAKVDVFGPVPNLASRLESMTKKFGVRILVDETVAESIRETSALRTRCRTRRMARICPAGMTTPTDIAEVMPPVAQGVMGEAMREQWEQTVDTFICGDWDAARRDLEEYFGKDPAAKLLIDFMDKSKGKPPANWEGVINLDTK